jgi:hypothetical protein
MSGINGKEIAILPKGAFK